MDPYKVLQIGGKYTKGDLSEKLDQPSLSFVREGKYRCKNSDSYLLFVDLEKSDKQVSLDPFCYLLPMNILG